MYCQTHIRRQIRSFDLYRSDWAIRLFLVPHFRDNLLAIVRAHHEKEYCYKMLDAAAARTCNLGNRGEMEFEDRWRVV